MARSSLEPAGPEPSFQALAAMASKHRSEGRGIVVVQGVGFVGQAVCAAVAAARDEAGAGRYLVLGLEVPTPAGRAKALALREGRPPIDAPDPELPALLSAAAREGRLTGSVDERVLGLADVILVDVGLDVELCDAPGVGIEVSRAPFEAALRTVGRHMRDEALVIVETTLPVGACERLVLPCLREERARRGLSNHVLLAHAYERVMPGRAYVASVRRFWRVVAGVDQASAQAASEFLRTVIDTSAYPLRQLPDTRHSELAKLLENSYRATNIAFLHEWTLLAEEAGVNLFEVVEAVRVRQGTHDNLRSPGFGVGGYCLTKDGFLAQWGAKHLLGAETVLGMTLEGLAINRRMPLHTLDLVRELEGGALAGRRIAVLGAAYLPEVGDTRNSPTAVFVDAAQAEGATVRVHDAYVARWPERPEVPLTADLAEALRGDGALVFAVPHPEYRKLAPEDLVSDRPRVIVDAVNVLDDATAADLHRRGCRVAGVGKGHWRARGYGGT